MSFSKSNLKHSNKATVYDVVPAKKLKLSQSWSKFREFVHTTSNDGSHSRGPSPFPEVRWADTEEVWDTMCKKETGVYVRRTKKVILEEHPSLKERMRAILLDWLLEVCEVHKFHRESFFLAVDFLDRYLGMTSNLPKSALQLVGVSCLFIASKIEEIYPPRVEEFAYVTDGACTVLDILEMELVILKKLNWALSPMTPNSWVKFFMQVPRTRVLVKNPTENKENEDLVLQEFSGKDFSKVMQLIELSMLDMDSLQFPYSQIAVSAMTFIFGKKSVLHYSGYQWDDFRECHKWMRVFYHALQDCGVPAPEPEDMENVSPDDLYNIQLHTFELQVLDCAEDYQKEIALQIRQDSTDIDMVVSRLPSSIEMSPPEDSGYCHVPSTTSRVLKPSVSMSSDSSVFMSPKSVGEDW